jgi:hypothetical protein
MGAGSATKYIFQEYKNEKLTLARTDMKPVKRYLPSSWVFSGFPKEVQTLLKFTI